MRQAGHRTLDQKTFFAVSLQNTYSKTHFNVVPKEPKGGKDGGGSLAAAAALSSRRRKKQEVFP
jgi:hypothetical protein